MEWKRLIELEKEKEYFKKLEYFLKEEYESQKIYPPKNEIYKAFEITPYENVKCVILGQDPYHGENQAMGLSFSVNKNIEIPKSLKNIYLELKEEYGFAIPKHGDLTYWAEQGVLLLNSVLTVKSKNPGSHKNKGWEIFTDEILNSLNRKENPIVFMLWGNYAKEKKKLLTNPNHLILETVHPSPFSVYKGFFGCNHFKLCNEFLITKNINPIDWEIK